MFQRLTSLFFSTPPPPEDPECPLALVSEEDEVDGWLIIDLPGEAWVGGPDSDSWACERASGRAAEGKGAAKALGSFPGLLGKRGRGSDTEGNRAPSHARPGPSPGSAALGPTPHVP